MTGDDNSGDTSAMASKPGGGRCAGTNDGDDADNNESLFDRVGGSVDFDRLEFDGGCTILPVLMVVGW